MTELPLRLTAALSALALLFISCAGPGDQQISAGMGTEDWFVEVIGGQALVEESAPTLRFGLEGKFTGHTGVNTMRATYLMDGADLELSPILTTRMAGPQELMNQEARLLEALKNARSVRLTGDQLRLQSGDGTTVLEARAH